MKLLYFIFLVSCTTINFLNACDTNITLNLLDPFTNKKVLVEPDNYILFWNYTDSDILFEVHVKATGWIAFGLSPNGNMINSDIVVTWVNQDGSYHFSDRHTSSQRKLPQVDSVQNWFPISASTRNGYTIARFTRKIKICDTQNEDLDIQAGTPYVIFAWGNTLSNNEINYHGASRGSKTVPLISSLNLKPDIDMSQVETTDFTVNTVLEPIKSMYYCQMFKLPAEWTTSKRHLVRFETIISPGNQPYFHHWLLYECEKRYETQVILNGQPRPGACFPQYATPANPFDNKWKNAFNFCRKISLGWAVGGDLIQDFPSDLAYPLGGSEDEFKYFFLEIHYDNPEQKPGIKENSGLRFYTTTNYRTTEFGVLTNGADPSPMALIIPPNANGYALNYDCHTDCLSKLFTETNEVNVFASMPHTHLKGKAVTTKIIRDGSEIEYITNNKYFDFNYQYINFLTHSVKLKKNDQIRTTCTYSNINSQDFITGGLNTIEEMCLDFIWYYPKSKTGTAICWESGLEAQLKDFLIGLNRTGEINYYPNFGTVTLKDPSLDLSSKFKDYFENTNKFQICASRDTASYKGVTKINALPIQEEICITDANNFYLKP